MPDGPERPSGNSRVIYAHCTRHGVTPGFTYLVVSKRNDDIELDPHVDRSCVITLDEPGATVLRDALTEWLGSG